MKSGSLTYDESYLDGNTGESVAVTNVLVLKTPETAMDICGSIYQKGRDALPAAAR